ncbi:MAG: ABC transporter permease subunit [Alphaproteobacteria bacterium]|nr:MAG: ABC transporter permease subunit [Alphaproteobacteria bacterium]
MARTVSPEARRNPWLGAWVGLLVATLGVWLGRSQWAWAVDYPRAWIVPLKRWISAFMKWLINDFDLGLFTFKELTRGIAWLLEWPHWLAKGLLAQGFKVPLGGEQVLQIPALSWFGLVGAMTLLAARVGDRRLALLVAGCFLYLAVFGQWHSAMITLSSIVVAVPLGIAGGVALGILGYRSPAFERAITPILDLMQTVPVFAYLVPVLFLFGFGPVSAMVATIIYAMPPMVRVTILALRMVPEEIKEFGRMAGCSRRQMTWKVLIPAARPSLMVGVNQVIMLSLNMVIIASMIGAGGLGHDVLASLRRLAIGDGLEAGIAITLVAIALDRLSQAFAERVGTQAHQPHTDEGGIVAGHPYLIGALVLLVGTTVLGLVVPAFGSYPEGLQVTTGAVWNDLVRWINVNFFDQLEAVKTFFLLNLLIPVKRFLLQLPWSAVVAMVALAGLQLGGWRLALLTGALATFIAVTGQWEKAMITVYLCGLSVAFATAIGCPIGMWAARNERVHKIVHAVIDTLQTLPSFVYLIPVVMLFRVGDFAAMIAIVAYALPPAVRYTDHGIRKIPPPLIEAARTSGCTRRQILWKVQLPLALPEIMLGVNQTIMFALSMLVITALVGTRDLGQEVYIALTKADTGRGIVAGVSVAFIAIIADRLIGAWAARRKRQLGFA